jgi:hypothetical protein
MTVTIRPTIKKHLEDPKWTLNNLYRIVDKSGNDVPFKMNSFQERLFDNQHNRNIVLKARQLGSTTFWCLYFLNKALFSPNKKLGIISYNLSSAHDIFAKVIKHALKTLPEKIKELPQCKVVADSAREIAFANGSSIRVDTTMRSGTLSGLLITEFGKICARYPMKAEEILTGSINTVPRDALCVIESTAEGASGPFFEMCTEAMNNKNEILNPMEWKFFFEPWWRNKEYEL